MPATDPSYFVVIATEDGARIEKLDREQLLKRLADGYYGNTGMLDRIPYLDPNHWGNNLLIVKGEIVVPRPVEVVRKYEV